MLNMIIVKKFIFGKATGLQSVTLLKKIYFIYFSRLKWRTAFFKTSLNVYFWMGNKLLNSVQILSSWSIFTCLKLWNMFSNSVNTVSLEQILMLFWHIHCGIGTSKWEYSLVSFLGWTQYPLKQTLNIHIYSLNKKRNK